MKKSIIYIIIDNIGSTAKAPKTAKVETGSVAAINEPKIKHSITDISILPKNLNWNQVPKIPPIDEVIYRGITSK